MKKRIAFELSDRPIPTSAWRTDWREAGYWMVAEVWAEDEGSYTRMPETNTESLGNEKKIVTQRAKASVKNSKSKQTIKLNFRPQ